MATNSIGTVTSTVVYFGVANTQSVTFSPVVGAPPASIPMPISFPSAPRVGVVGKITVHKASDVSIVETIDLGALQSLASGSFTCRYQNKNVGGGSGGVTEQTTALDAEREHVQVTIPFSGARLFARLTAAQ